MEPVADILFDYLRDVIYNPSKAVLDVGKLPEPYQDLGSGLQFFAGCVMEAKELAQALSTGNLDAKLPPPDNEIAAPLKSLQASLKHLTWQAQQIARGDYRQRVDFMGDFAVSFNAMAQQLEERRQLDTRERSKLQQYINLLLSNTPNILLAFDTEARLVLASRSYIRQSRYSSMNEIQGMPFAELFAGVSTEEFIRKIKTLLDDVRANRNTVTLEQSVDFGRDGNLRTYLIHAAPMLYDDGADMGAVVVFDDITEIIRARREAERALEAAERSSRAKTEFLARMSHEMRTPMNVILGMADIGRKNADSERKDRCFEHIGGAARRLTGIIDDIFDISNIEADRLELSLREFRFEDMLDGVMHPFRAQARENNQSFVSDIDASIPQYVISDEKRLAQVLGNLLSNAVKFTPEGGTVTLAVKKTAQTGDLCRIQFAVKDTGIGMSEEQQKRLFVPFEQADGGFSRKYGGAGLGLAISKRIVERMGGSITAKSEPGKGALFMFEVSVQTCAGANECAHAVSAKGIFEGKRILIVEDVELNRDIVSMFLEETGAKIGFAFDGAEAVEKFCSDPGAYDFIFMDLQMPGVDGFEATRRIRSSGLPEADTIPIVAMTANVLPEDVERCLAAGMNGHLGKPFDLGAVIAKIGEYLL